MSRLLQVEKETIILFDEGTITATVETCSPALQRRMDEYCAKSPACCLLHEDEHAKKYRCPKSWVKVQMPRQLTEEQRQKLRERALKTLKGRKES